MKTFEVSWNIFRQYMLIGDSPIMILEDEEFIKIYQVVSFYEICYIYEKIIPEQTVIWKAANLTSSRIIYPFREIKDKKQFVVMETNGTSTYTGSRPSNL